MHCLVREVEKERLLVKRRLVSDNLSNKWRRREYVCQKPTERTSRVGRHDRNAYAKKERRLRVGERQRERHHWHCTTAPDKHTSRGKKNATTMIIHVAYNPIVQRISQRCEGRVPEIQAGSWLRRETKGYNGFNRVANNTFQKQKYREMTKFLQPKQPQKRPSFNNKSTGSDCVSTRKNK